VEFFLSGCALCTVLCAVVFSWSAPAAKVVNVNRRMARNRSFMNIADCCSLTREARSHHRPVVIGKDSYQFLAEIIGVLHAFAVALLVRPAALFNVVA